MWLISVQLFEKLKLQENSADDVSNMRHKAHETASKWPRLSDSAEAKQVSPKVIEKKVCQKYGKVQTRHLNQLFIRGENIILINPQPLWYQICFILK